MLRFSLFLTFFLYLFSLPGKTVITTQAKGWYEKYDTDSTQVQRRVSSKEATISCTELINSKHKISTFEVNNSYIAVKKLKKFNHFKYAMYSSEGGEKLTSQASNLSESDYPNFLMSKNGRIICVIPEGKKKFDFEATLYSAENFIDFENQPVIEIKSRIAGHKSYLNENMNFNCSTLGTGHVKIYNASNQKRKICIDLYKQTSNLTLEIPENYQDHNPVFQARISPNGLLYIALEKSSKTKILRYDLIDILKRFE